MKIILVGHTVGIKRCFEALEGSHHTIVGVFTHARHLHESDLALFEIRKNHFEDYAWDVFRTPEEFRVPLFEYEHASGKPVKSIGRPRNASHIKGNTINVCSVRIRGRYQPVNTPIFVNNNWAEVRRHAAVAS